MPGPDGRHGHLPERPLAGSGFNGNSEETRRNAAVTHTGAVFTRLRASIAAALNSLFDLPLPLSYCSARHLRLFKPVLSRLEVLNFILYKAY